MCICCRGNVFTQLLHRGERLLWLHYCGTWLFNIFSQIQNYFTTWRQSPWGSLHNNCIFQPNTCGYSPCVTSSLTRGWVRRLQFLLVLASAVILRSEPRGTHDYILLSQIRDSPNLEGQILVSISSRNYMLSILYDTSLIENTASSSCSIVTCVLVEAGTCLPSRFLAILGDTQAVRWSHKPAF
jgi:hypothetical protein